MGRGRGRDGVVVVSDGVADLAVLFCAGGLSVEEYLGLVEQRVGVLFPPPSDRGNNASQ